MENVYLAIVLAPLTASVITGLFGRYVGRAGAHWFTIALNGDGMMDFVVSGFGQRQGNVAWFESQVDGSYRENVLINRAGEWSVDDNRCR